MSEAELADICSKMKQIRDKREKLHTDYLANVTLCDNEFADLKIRLRKAKDERDLRT